MFFLTPLLTLVLLSLTSAHAPRPIPHCLSQAEATSLATAWLHLWDTNAVSSLSDLTPILSPNIISYDEAYGGPIVGISAFLTAVTAPGNYTTTDVKQFPLFVLHSCDQVMARWGYTAITAGFES